MPKVTKGKNQTIVEVLPENFSSRNKGLNELIAQKAYEIYLSRGKEDGHDVEDWLEAERHVVNEMKSKDFMGKWLKTL